MMTEPIFKIARFDMEYDVSEEFRFCGGLHNERVEAFYHWLGPLIKEKGDAVNVIAHPATINNMMAYEIWDCWDDIALRRNMPAAHVVMWKAGTRSFWNGSKPLVKSRQAMVWASRGYPTSYIEEYPEHDRNWWCGDYEPPKKPKWTDRIDFYCERGAFGVEIYWGSINMGGGHEDA
jgi:hypothetical protein